MANIPSKVYDRLSAGIKKFQPILNNAKSRDVNESDTVIIITDLLSEVFGYDKYSEITSEFMVRSTYCDLAIKLDGKLTFLLEVKAIGLELKDTFVKQAVDYAANQGIDFVVLTNGSIWRVYKISFTKPIDQELVFEFDFLSLNYKNSDDIDRLSLLSKEGWLKSFLYDYHSQKQALSKFFLGALILSDPLIEVVRRELRKISPDVKVNPEQIREVIFKEVLKREVIEGEKADEAKKKINKALNKVIKSKPLKQIDQAGNNNEIPDKSTLENKID
ncbi:MAG: type I restriction enzyme HsdR N-terminal domain-containing protein [Ignavibacteriales bacterium]|nr:type I restriction enzyme HsdR N-terminal domain-containing protein [Ignavibacteriales bacterium]